MGDGIEGGIGGGLLPAAPNQAQDTRPIFTSDRYTVKGDGTEKIFPYPWFTDICREGVSPLTLEGLEVMLPLFGVKDVASYYENVREDLQSLPKQQQRGRFIHYAVSGVAFSSVLSIDQKVALLKDFSHAMYTAPSPLNGKSIVRKHVQHYFNRAHSAATFYGGERVFQHADELLWRVDRELPRELTRRAVIRGIFEETVGVESRNVLHAIIGLEAVMEAEQAQEQSTRALIRRSERATLTKEQDKAELDTEIAKSFQRLGELMVKRDELDR